MAYNLPPPWDSGYAIPDNVRDEGLERRGFVTKQMPRGTYDNPRVGSGGYVLPANVRAEEYGQGTYTTKWLPRGYVDAPPPIALNQRPRVLADRRVAGRTRAVRFAAPIMVQPQNQGSAVAVSGDDLPPQFVTYGERAADKLLQSVAGIPWPTAKARLKATMDAIDPTLWTRAATLTQQYMAQGYRGIAALRAGLAGAMSTGIAAEILRAGMSRTAPQARSLLGLGCYGCAAALGAPVAVGLGAVGTAIQQFAQGSSPTSAYKVGEFQLSDQKQVRTTFAASAMTAAQKSSFANILAKASAAILATKINPTTGIPPSAIAQLSATGWGSGSVPVEFLGNGIPVAKFKDPTSGQMQIVFARSIGTPASPTLEMWWSSDPGLIAAILQPLVELVAIVVKNVIAPVLDSVGALACQLISSPGIAAASAGVATAAGVPPTAGVAGAQIAQQACSQPPPPPPVIAPSSSMLPVAILGGAALVAVLATRKKKAPTP